MSSPANENEPEILNSFHLMAKPAGPRCNMRCHYCFYTEKEALLGSGQQVKMSDEALEAYVRNYIEVAEGPEVNFAWQGGEPTLMGLDFFRRAVDLQKQYAGDRRITNSLQTNGTLLDDEWCKFLADHEFLVGLSIDGPEHIHDKYRLDRGGNPTFEKVQEAMHRMQNHGVNFNTLTCVTVESAEQPLEVYDFLRDQGAEFMQFIPIVERLPGDKSTELGLELAEPQLEGEEESTRVTNWSVRPGQYGKFLKNIFDKWVKNHVGSTFVQIFDVALNAWMDQEPPLCNFATNCGNAMIIEYNGDLYSCDHFVYPDHRLGNIREDSLEEMVRHPSVRKLGRYKSEGLPQKCRDCEVLFVCHGGCPKNRFKTTEDGEPGLNYLCEGYRDFFNHIDQPMKTMARLLRQGRPPAEIMHSGRRRKRAASPSLGGAFGDVGRNDPCPCGSGKKFKRCCGRAV